MKRTRKRNLSRLLEALFIKESPEAPEESLYGQYLFAPNRKDLGKNEKEEENTDEEGELEVALNVWYNGDGSDLSDMIGQVKNQVKKGYHKNILQAPVGKQAYRIISDVDLPAASKILNLSERDIVDTEGEPSITYSPGILTPNSYSDLQSWTLSDDLGSFQHIMDNIGIYSVKPGRCIIIMRAEVSDESFIINPKGIESVEGFAHYAYEENETISFGPVKLNRASFACASFNDAIIPQELPGIVHDLAYLITE